MTESVSSRVSLETPTPRATAAPRVPGVPGVPGVPAARARIAVTVLEKHADFLRDFRGDTVHASTVALLDELGLGAEFRELPQSRLTGALLPGTDLQRVPIDIFAARWPAPYNYVAMVPQSPGAESHGPRAAACSTPGRLDTPVAGVGQASSQAPDLVRMNGRRNEREATLAGHGLGDANSIENRRSIRRMPD